ncbi:MAG: DUF3592 domain-containing protein [Actinomycetota bacterium]
MSDPRRFGRTPIALAMLVAVGALGVFLIGLAVKQRNADAGFSARAVEVEARVLSATETRVRRNPASTRAQVSFSTPDEVAPAIGEVIDCPEARVPVDAEVIRVLYDPTNRTDIRVPGCVDKDFKLFLALGILVLALDAAIFAAIRKARRTTDLPAPVVEVTDPDAEPIVVKQKQSSVIAIYGFLAVVFAIALVRGHLGAETTTGRVVGDLIFGALTLGSIAALVRFQKRPGRITVARDVISYSHRGATTPIELHRTGDLYIGRTFTASGIAAAHYLKVDGSDAVISLAVFDRNEVERACLAMGWGFSERS